MTEMLQKVTICCVAVLLSLTSVSSVQKLKTLDDLKEINFGQSVPEESLRLLHWFANIVDIDNNNVIWLTFDPDNHDFGSHLYHNSERLLNPLPEGQQYYTIGNVNADGAEELPDYVVDRMANMQRNLARVVIRVREESRGTSVHQVYVTQHYNTSENQGTRYDPDHTYHVTTKLLRQIRNLSVENSLTEVRNIFGSNIDDSQLWDIRTTWGDLASLGLLLFIVIHEKHLRRHSNRPQPAPRINRPPHVAVPRINRPPHVAVPRINRPPHVAVPRINRPPHVAVPRINRPPHVAVEIPENTENWQNWTNADASDNVCKCNVCCCCLGVCFLIIIVISIILYFIIIGRHTI